MFQKINRIHKSIHKCNEREKFSFANLLMFPNKISADVWSILNDDDDNLKIEVYFTNTDYMIGGYIAEILQGYQIIHLKEIILNPKLKSTNYSKTMIEDLGEYGLNIFGENFKGIISTSNRDKNKKSIDEKHQAKIRALINSGGRIVVECARVKNQILHFVYIPYNGGLEQGEVKEIFRKVTHI